MSLTQTTVQFAKLFVTLVDDLLRLYTVELEKLIAQTLETVFSAQLAQFENAAKADKFKSEVRSFIM